MLDIGSIVGALLKPALALLEWLLKKLKRTDAGRPLPGQALRVVPDAARFFIWGDGMRGNTPVMSVRGSFYLTNITSRSDIVITRTFVQVFQWKGFRPSRERFDGF